MKRKSAPIAVKDTDKAKLFRHDLLGPGRSLDNENGKVGGGDVEWQI